MWSLRWHFTNKSVTGAPYSIKSYSLSHSRTLWWRVRWLKQWVPSWGRGGTAAIIPRSNYPCWLYSAYLFYRISYRYIQAYDRKCLTRRAYMLLWRGGLQLLMVDRWSDADVVVLMLLLRRLVLDDCIVGDVAVAMAHFTSSILSVAHLEFDFRREGAQPSYVRVLCWKSFLNWNIWTIFYHRKRNNACDFCCQRYVSVSFCGL